MMDSMREVAAAMSARARAQEIIANNLANMSTSGFRRLRVAFATELAGAAGVPGQGAPGTPGAEAAPEAGNLPSPPPAPASPELLLRTHLDLTPAPPELTGQPSDVAIRGRGFFVIETERGPRYTRDGSFTVNAAGELAHRSGGAVAGDGGGAIQGGEAGFHIDERGAVVAGGAEVGRLQVVDFPDEVELAPEGAGLLQTDAVPEPIASPDLLPGHAEGANVDPVLEMVTMMDSFRQFEAAGHAIRAADESLGALLDTTRGTLR